MTLVRIGGEHSGYLRDESRRTGQAETISFPASAEEIAATLKDVAGRGRPVTIQGARTGIVAGAVPRGGHILSLERMNRVTGLRRDKHGAFLLEVQPGVLLDTVRKICMTGEVETEGWSEASLRTLNAFRSAPRQFFPPDPTEPSASIGGMVAANASGACSYHYGATRAYIEALDIVLADGRLLKLRRGQPRATGRRFNMLAEGGSCLAGCLPAYAWPQVKNAAGYFVAEDMDLLDLFIGAEGTLGVIARVELRLLPAPAFLWGLAAFLPSEKAVTSMVHTVRGRHAAARPVALEYFDAAALNLVRKRAVEGQHTDCPEIPAQAQALLYIEMHGSDEEVIADAMEQAAACMTDLGGREDEAWLAATPAELQRMKTLRHAVPESVNQLLDERRKEHPGLSKLGTDMAVPDDLLEQSLALYRAGLHREHLEAVMFGHIGNNHVHVNILPRQPEEYQRGMDLYLEWARQVSSWGGSISAEHGVGKIKSRFLELMYGSDGVAQMRALKQVFDPGGVLNPGNLFPG